MNYTFINSTIVSINSGIIVLNVSGKTRTFVDAKLISAVDGKIVLDLPKYTTKNGAYLVIQLTDTIERIFIVSAFGQCHIYYHVSQRNNTISYKQYWTDDSHIRNATPEEIQELNDQLAEKEKCWNPNTMQIENLRWQPVTGQTYYYVALEVRPYVSCHIWRNDNIDNEHHQSKNCFKTEGEAKVVMEKIEKVLLEN